MSEGASRAQLVANAWGQAGSPQLYWLLLIAAALGLGKGGVPGLATVATALTVVTAPSEPGQLNPVRPLSPLPTAARPTDRPPDRPPDPPAHRPAHPTASNCPLASHRLAATGSYISAVGVNII